MFIAPKGGRSPRASPHKIIGSTIYLVAAGAAVTLLRAVTREWATLVVGVPMAGMGLAALGRGEATSWLRGDLDERRQGAVDHGFKIAFLVMVWWVGGLTVVASTRQVPLGLWSAGTVVALAVAYVDYALVLRRT